MNHLINKIRCANVREKIVISYNTAKNRLPHRWLNPGCSGNTGGKNRGAKYGQDHYSSFIFSVILPFKV